MRVIGFIGRWAWFAVAMAALPIALWMFAKHGPPDQPLVSGPFAVAAPDILLRAGVSGTQIVVRDGACGWGTVSGLGADQRIVVSRAVTTQPLDGALWALAHEAAHVRYHDPLLGVLFGWFWLTLSLGLGQALAASAVKRWGWKGVVAFPLGLALGYAVGTPAFNAIQRQIERRADRFGVEVAGSGAAAARFVSRASACMGRVPEAGIVETLYSLNHDAPATRIAMLRALGPSFNLEADGHGSASRTRGD